MNSFFSFRLFDVSSEADLTSFRVDQFSIKIEKEKERIFEKKKVKK